jgi:hypothetical protein
MSDPSYTVFELTLVETGGPLPGPGVPALVCHVGAFHLTPGPVDDGRVTVLARSRPGPGWREFGRRTTRDESRAILDRLDRLGLPDRRPTVTGAFDTSDTWAHLHLAVRLWDKTAVVEVPCQSTGFEGPDADALRELVREVFALAGYDEYSAVLYGPKPAVPVG